MSRSASTASVRVWRGVLLLAVLVLASACSLTVAPDSGPNAVSYEGPPQVRIASPLPNATYLSGTAVNILARIENAGPDIAQVQITLNGSIIGETTNPNPAGAAVFTVTNSWPAGTAGPYTIGVVAVRADGTRSDTAEVQITVRAVDDIAPVTDNTGNTPVPQPAQPTADTSTGTSGQTVPNTPAPQQPTQQPQQPTQAPAVTNTPAPPPTNTPVPASPTPDRPRVRVSTGANIRLGPSTVFEPPLGSVAAGGEYDLVAVNPAGDWYKIRVFNGEYWIFSGLAERLGPTGGVPVDAGPPTPIPATPTPLPTNTPIPSQVDLVIDSWTTNPGQPVCNQAATETIVVRNAGSGNFGGGRLVVEDLFNNNIGGSVAGDIPALGPGASAQITLQLTVNNNFLEGHTRRLRLDPDNAVAEIDENNNSRTYQYVLAQGNC